MVTIPAIHIHVVDGFHIHDVDGFVFGTRPSKTETSNPTHLEIYCHSSSHPEKLVFVT